MANDPVLTLVVDALQEQAIAPAMKPRPIVVHISPRRWVLALSTSTERRGNGPIIVGYTAIRTETYRSEQDAVSAAIAYPAEASHAS